MDVHSKKIRYLPLWCRRIFPPWISTRFFLKSATMQCSLGDDGEKVDEADEKNPGCPPSPYYLKGSLEGNVGKNVWVCFFNEKFRVCRSQRGWIRPKIWLNLLRTCLWHHWGSFWCIFLSVIRLYMVISWVFSSYCCWWMVWQCIVQVKKTKRMEF